MSHVLHGKCITCIVNVRNGLHRVRRDFPRVEVLWGVCAYLDRLWLKTCHSGWSATYSDSQHERTRSADWQKNPTALPVGRPHPELDQVIRGKKVTSLVWQQNTVNIRVQSSDRTDAHRPHLKAAESSKTGTSFLTPAISVT